jgi:lipopolysaccharide export system ATP-binding protein
VQQKALKTSPHLLGAHDLTKSYGRHEVVKGVKFSVTQGEIVGLLGPNGAGKTTTFRMVVGMIRPDSGQISFRGRDITTLPMYRRARLGMGYLAQEPSVFQGLSVLENIVAILEAIGVSRRERAKRANDSLEEFGLRHLSPQKAYTLSGGERRRLEICRAMVTNPFLLLLDEPFSGVDPIAVDDLQDVILRLKAKGIGVLLTDHNVRETLSVTDRSYMIHEGVIWRHGNAEELVSDEEVKRAYLGEDFSM